MMAGVARVQDNVAPRSSNSGQRSDLAPVVQSRGCVAKGTTTTQSHIAFGGFVEPGVFAHFAIARFAHVPSARAFGQSARAFGQSGPAIPSLRARRLLCPGVITTCHVLSVPSYKSTAADPNESLEGRGGQIDILQIRSVVEPSTEPASRLLV
jgi:hypothetical protein